jgi:hypothetical protein
MGIVGDHGKVAFQQIVAIGNYILCYTSDFLLLNHQFFPLTLETPYPRRIAEIHLV